MRLQVPDEASIAHTFEVLVGEFPDVAAGSYPVCSSLEGGTSLGYNVAISLEAKDEGQVDAAVLRLKELLRSEPGDEAGGSGCVVAVLRDVDDLAEGITDGRPGESAEV